MTSDKPAAPKNFFKDKDGHIVLWQSPNIPLYGWIVFKVLSMVVSEGNLKTGCEHLSMAFLFTWAFLELTKGINYFRRLLGFIVFISLILGYFK